MLGVLKAEFFEEFRIVGSLIIVQFVFSVYSLFMSYLMSIGLTPLFLVIYGSFATSIFLFPFSIYFERSNWPRKFSLKLLSQFLLIAFGGVTLFQTLMLTGIKKTSPAVASAMPNLAPGLIFIIAWVLRFEKVDLKRIYGKVKILGTLVCIVGAIMMSLLYASGSRPVTLMIKSNVASDDDTIVGTMCLMAGVLVMSFMIVLQAATLGDFPAPMSLCAVTSLLGAILTAIFQLIQEHKLDIGSPVVSAGYLAGYALLGGAVGGTCTSLQSWAMKKRGPVFISTFSPVGTVFSVIVSALAFGDSVTLGSVVGMLLMFNGLYFVLWAKKKEDLAIQNEDTPICRDVEKPLLS